MCEERAATDGRRRRRERSSEIWGKWPWGRTNAVVKSEVAVACSQKHAAATLATARSAIRATATTFFFFPLPLIFLHILFFSFHLLQFLSFSITFLFDFHLILYHLVVASLEQNALLQRK